MATLAPVRYHDLTIDRAKLDELEAWLEWMCTQPAADRIPGWLAEYRRLRNRERV